MKKVPLPKYTRAEDIVNSVTHAIGVPFFIVAGVLLLKLQIGKVATVQIVSSVLYIASAIVVFLCSAIYHGLKPGFPKQIARLIDHSDIYFMISGAITSFFMAHVYDHNPKTAIRMIILMWSLSAVGIVLTFMDLKKFNVPQIFMYVLLGWISVFGMRSVYAAGGAETDFVRGIIFGGIFITVGAAIYFVGKKFRYFHAVFHLFVLGGNIIIFLATYQYFLKVL